MLTFSFERLNLGEPLFQLYVCEKSYFKLKFFLPNRYEELEYMWEWEERKMEQIQKILMRASFFLLLCSQFNQHFYGQLFLQYSNNKKDKYKQ